MTQFTNKDKAIHGVNSKKALEQILLECEKNSYIKEIVKNYRCGFAEYDDKQFFCNFVIVFHDNKKWIVNITPSFRSDRLKGNQWDTYNIKEIDKKISKSILVYPDDIPEKDKEEFLSYKMKILNHIHYSAIDDIVSQTELFELIENYATGNLSKGQKRDKVGNSFESMIASVLSSRENFEKWQTNDKTKVGVQYNYFKKIVEFFQLEKKDIKGIEATSDKKIIGSLATSGMPKTDIIVYVYFKDENKDTEHFTISCKKTNAKSVSVHQYSANAFADALDSKNIELKNLLNEFQLCGSLRDFGEQNQTALTNALKPYLNKLVKWVLGGYGGKFQNELQIANYILVSDENDIYIHSIDEYANELLKSENETHFGTPFSWTYASGRKGKDIQLKCKIIK